MKVELLCSCEKEELEKRYNVDENAIKRYVELQIKEKGEE